MSGMKVYEVAGQQFVMIEGNLVPLTESGELPTGGNGPTTTKAKGTAAKARKVEIPQHVFKVGDSTVTLSQVYASKTGKAYRAPRVRIETRVNGREGTSGMSPALTFDVLREIRNLDEDAFAKLTSDAREKVSA